VDDQQGCIRDGIRKELKMTPEDEIKKLKSKVAILRDLNSLIVEDLELLLDEFDERNKTKWSAQEHSGRDRQSELHAVLQKLGDTDIEDSLSP
jgi:hypothetical protein